MLFVLLDQPSDHLALLHVLPVLNVAFMLGNEVLLGLALIALIPNGLRCVDDLLAEAFVVPLACLFDHRLDFCVVLLVALEVGDHGLLRRNLGLVDACVAAIELVHSR